MAPKPRTPASMRVRAAVRPWLARLAAGGLVGSGAGGSTGGSTGGAEHAGDEDHRPLVLVALSGGADSLALAAAVAAEAGGVGRAGGGLRAGAVIVDHGLQQDSAAVALRAAEQAGALGLAPVMVRRVEVDGGQASATGGTEAAARTARYDALAATAAELAAGLVLTAHTRDDQAEQVLLALARGSGTRSLAGIPPTREIGGGESGERILIARPLLDERFEVTREVTEAACTELGLAPWRDPHNADRSFARVRVRLDALPLLERELGPGVAAALARSADLAREDADALDALAEAQLASMMRRAAASAAVSASVTSAAVSIDAAALLELPAALRGRVIRLLAAREFDAGLSREHTQAIASLVTAWRGQGPIHAPRITVTREGAELVFRAR